MEPIRIIIADDHALFRNGLKMLLSNYPNLQIVGEVPDGKKLIDLLATTPADIVLIDIEMPILNGFEAAKYISQNYPSVKSISLSMYGEEEYYYRMIEAGVKGFILKNSEIKEVIEAIEKVYQGETFFSPEILYNVVKNIKTVTNKDIVKIHLSQREKEVLEYICKGLSNQEIADTLFISKRTVEKHRSSLLAKTNTKNTAQLVMFAIENKLID